MKTERMRILLVHNRYRGEQPSGENQVVDQEMRLLGDAGHQVSIFERRSDDISSMPLAKQAAVPLRVPWNRGARVELAERLRAERPDVVHIHNTFPLLSPSVVMACADSGIPTVATLHNYTLLCTPGTLYRHGGVCMDCVNRLPYPSIRHGCYRNSRLATIPLAANIVLNSSRWLSGVARFFCLSEAQRQLFAHAGMPSDRLVVKHNFVPDPRHRRNGPGEYVLFLGRLAEEKGVRLLMRAWEAMAGTGWVNVPLVLAGTGPLQREVAEWARERDDVRYLGLIGKEECRQVTARAAALVAPSMWLESFGLVVVEAMAAGVPAVAAAHGAFPELVQHGTTGLLHDPGDAESLAECLRHVVLDVERNQAMGLAARQRYERDFVPAVGLRRLVEEYRDVIATADTRRQGPLDEGR